MMLIKLFIFFLLLLILPDWYIELTSIVYHKNGFAGLIGYQHYFWSQG